MDAAIPRGPVSLSFPDPDATRMARPEVGAKMIPLPQSQREQWRAATKVGYELARLGPDTTGLADELRATLTDTTDDCQGEPKRPLSPADPATWIRGSLL